MFELVLDAKEKNQIESMYIEEADEVESSNSIVRKRSNGEKPVFVRKHRKFTEEELSQMRDMYSKVVVNDYGDEYHLSEEERKKKFMYYDVFSQIVRRKRKYRKLDEFVKVYRLYMDALKVVADDNGIYDPNEFTEKVIKGKIKVYGLEFPRYVGKDKKTINWEFVSEYVFDRDKDPEELSSQRKSIYDDMTEDEVKNMIFTENEIELYEELARKSVNDEDCVPIEDDDVDFSIVLEKAKKSDTKELFESSPELLRSMRDKEKERKKSRDIGKRLDSYVFDMTEEDFKIIAREDQKRGFVYESDMPIFHGDISNRDAYKKYLYMLQEYEDNHIKENYHGKQHTIAEIQEIELKDDLESAGWNLRKLYHHKSEKKKLAKAYKADKKREEALKRKLIEIQNHKKKLGSKGKNKGIEFDAKNKKKGKKKKDKKS